MLIIARSGNTGPPPSSSLRRPSCDTRPGQPGLPGKGQDGKASPKQAFVCLLIRRSLGFSVGNCAQAQK